MARRNRCLVVAVGVLASVQVAAPAYAAVSVSRAELDESELRIEGTASAGRDITVDGVVMARSDTSGSFRIQRDPYSPPADCTVDVGDGSATTTPVRLSGCTATETPPPPSGDTTAPSVPTDLAAGLTASTADLTWTASTDDVGVAGYRVSRNGVLLPGTPTGTSFTDPDLAAGTYTYTVVALDAAGNVSGASNSASVTVPTAQQPPPADTTAPTVPTNFTLVLRGTDNTELAWTDSTDDTALAGYRIMRNDTVLASTYLNPSYGDTRLSPGTYTYSVAAVDTAGNMSGWTESRSVTVLPPPETDTTAPSVPTNPTATVVGTTISLSWDLSHDDTAVTGYRIFRNGTALTTTDSASYVDSGLSAGTHTCTVSAFDAAGTSPRSPPASRPQCRPRACTSSPRHRCPTPPWGRRTSATSSPATRLARPPSSSSWSPARSPTAPASRATPWRTGPRPASPGPRHGPGRSPSRSR